MDDAVPCSDRGPHWNEGLEPDQPGLSAAGITGPRHVVVGGDHIANRHSPLPTEDIPEIDLRDLAAVTWIDAHDPRCAAFDGGEQELARAGRAQDRRQPAQPGLGVAGRAVSVEQAPMRVRAVDAPVDLLTDRGIEAAVTFGKAADPQIAVATRQAGRRNSRQLQLWGSAPADAASHGWIIGAAEDSARILPGKHPVDSGRPVAVPAETAHLRQEVRGGAILCDCRGSPGAGRVIATEYPRRPTQVPIRCDEYRHWHRQLRAVAVGREGDFFEG